MKTKNKLKRAKTPKQKDRIDALVDNLDKYYFRMGAADNILSSSAYVQMKDFTDNVRGLFETPKAKAAKKLLYENLEEVKDAELSNALEEAVMQWQSYEENFPMLLGYVLGLRIAGMSSEQTKAMARTWRLGYPQDDED